MGNNFRICYGTYASNSSFLSLYEDYLNGKLDVNGDTGESAVRFWTAGVFICPSAKRPSVAGKPNNFSNLAYGMTAGSTLDRPVSMEKEQSMFDIAKNKYGKMKGSTPVIWVDRLNYCRGNYGNNGGPAETNHSPSENGAVGDTNPPTLFPQGGNAVSLDGSGKWYRFVGTDSTTVDDVFWANSGNNYVALPTATVYLRSGSDGNLDPTAGQSIYANGTTFASRYY